MNARDNPLTELCGPPVDPRWAARRLSASALRDGYVPRALHAYTDSDSSVLYWRIRLKHPNTGEKWVRPMRREGIDYALGEPDFPNGKPLYRLYGIAQGDAAQPIWFVEGEAKADALIKLGMLATTSGSATSDDKADFKPLRGRHVIMWPGNDTPGREHMQRVATKLRALGCTIQTIDIDDLGLPEHGDVVDYLAAHPRPTAADLMALTMVEQGATASPIDTSVANVAAVRVELLHAESIKPEPVSWLWHEWLARGKLHILAGAPGTGKTTIALAIAATLTQGGRWPDGTRAEPGNVLMWSGEDDPADTLTPRLIACGADLSRLHFVGDSFDADGRRPFDPATDIRPLQDAAARIGGVKLLIVDPVVSAVAGDSHKNTETRRALQPLVDLASRLDCAVLGISHFSKGSAGKDPVERVTGSLAFGALARVVLAAAKLPDNEDGKPAGRLLARAKSNIGPDSGGFRYELEQIELPEHPGVVASRLLWRGAVEGTARELLAEVEQDADGRGEIADAEKFLTGLLTDGPGPAKQVQRDADSAGYAWRTMQEAARRLKVERRKVGMKEGWVWALTHPPKMQGAPKMHEDADSKCLHLHASSGDIADQVDRFDDAGPVIEVRL